MYRYFLRYFIFDICLFCLLYLLFMTKMHLVGEDL